MRGLTIHQPWATLIAIGQKRVETRHWQTRYRGWIAIHAGKSDLYQGLGAETPFREALEAVGADPMQLRRGVVVAFAKLLNCLPLEVIRPTVESRIKRRQHPVHEIDFGDWTPGRFGFILGEVNPLRVPYIMRGSQGLFPISAVDQAKIRERLALPFRL